MRACARATTPRRSRSTAPSSCSRSAARRGRRSEAAVAARLPERFSTNFADRSASYAHGPGRSAEYTCRAARSKVRVRVGAAALPGEGSNRRASLLRYEGSPRSEKHDEGTEGALTQNQLNDL